MVEKLSINPSALPVGLRSSVSAIENLPHRLWIRYLITKRYPFTKIINELKILGLSAPWKEGLQRYFETVIYPAAKKFHVEHLYNDFHEVVTKQKRMGRKYYVISFRLDIAPNPELEVPFLKFLTYLDVDMIWNFEVHKHYGTVSNYPVDEDGDRFFASGYFQNNSVERSIEKIVQHPKRYLLDRMILENLPTRIITNRAKEAGIGITEYETILYIKAFFNISSRSLEEKIKLLEMEKKYFEQVVRDASSNTNKEYSSKSIGERKTIIQSAQTRIEEIEKNLFDLNNRHHRAVTMMMTSEKQDYEEMLDTMIRTTYKKFVDLSSSSDRESITPLTNLSKSFVSLAEKKQNMEKFGNRSGSDYNANESLLELYKQTMSDMQGEDGAMASEENFDGTYEDIAGIEELGVSYDEDTGEEE